MKPMSAWLFLLHVRDHIWRDKQWSLETRMQACATVWKLAVTAPIATVER